MPLFKCSASKAKPKNGIAYVTDEKKAKIVTVRNLFEDEDYAKQFEETASRFGKGDKFDERKYYHCKLSCARQDNVSPEKAHAYAEELVAKLFQNYECVIATHTDTQTVHSHIKTSYKDYKQFLERCYPEIFYEYEHFNYLSLDSSDNPRWADIEFALSIDYDAMMDDALQ